VGAGVGGRSDLGRASLATDESGPWV